MSSTNTATSIPLPMPKEKLDLALKVAENVAVEDRAFDDINFIESHLWLQGLRLVNDHGIPQATKPGLREWAEHTFRLNQSTQQAKKLRERSVNRQWCMEINREGGTVFTVESLKNLYLLLQDFHLSGVEVTFPENENALDSFIALGTRLVPGA